MLYHTLAFAIALIGTSFHAPSSNIDGSSKVLRLLIESGVHKSTDGGMNGDAFGCNGTQTHTA